ncbi:phage tail tape measure protein [Sutcliffiella sp. NC1]|uniref:phage tail tape measure protein n=1 Tax=Sutcliffiella sp. NC1 TaxID=3004096 RepID=UPI0022DDD9B2|nr:phage tail tape measure protein [Sutcliffiella sp. NC1]WBL16380.1 phage tail tape measure protein [Sutcliffiella sp. NC1]
MSTYDLGGYKAEITVDSSGLEKGLKDADKAMQNSEKKTSKMGKVIGGLAMGAIAGLGTALVGIGTAGFNAAKEFEQASNIIRLGTGATGDALKDLENSYKEVFKSVPQGSEEVATVLADLNTRTGETGETLETLSKKYLDLSRISGEASADLVESGSRGFEAWGIGAEESMGKMDNLWKIAQTTGAGVGDLMSQMDKHGATMRNAGLSYDEAALLMGNLEAAGYDADKAMGAFSKGIANIAKEGKNPAEVLPQVIKEIQNMEDAGEATGKAMEVFGTKAGSEMAEMIRSGAFSIEELEGIIASSSETIDKAGEDTLTFGERFQMFKDKAMVALIPVGEFILNIAEKVLPILETAFDKTFEIVTGIIDFFRDKISIMQGDSDGTFSEMGETISSIMSSIGKIIDTTVTFISRLWEKYGEKYLSYISKTFGNIKKVISGTLDVILGVVNTVLGILTGDWDKAWSGIQKITEGVKKILTGIISQAIETVKTTISTGLDFVREFFSSSFEKVGNTIDSAYSNIKRIFNKIKDAIISPVENAVDKVREMIGKIKEAFNFKWELPKLKLPKVSVNMEKNGWGIPIPKFDIKWHKYGGFFDQPTIAGLGEAGKEAIVPLVGKQMDPFADAVYNRLKDRLLGGGTTTNNNRTNNQEIHIEMPITINSKTNLDERELARISKNSFGRLINKMENMGMVTTRI